MLSAVTLTVFASGKKQLFQMEKKLLLYYVNYINVI